LHILAVIRFGGRTAASSCVTVCVSVCVYDELDRNVEWSWHMSLNYPDLLLTERKEKNRILVPVVPTTWLYLLGRNVELLERVRECGRYASITGVSLKELRRSLDYVFGFRLVFVSKLIDIISRFGDSILYAMMQWRKRRKRSFCNAYSSLQ